MSRRERILRRGLAAGALLLCALSPVHAAESLPDPTRPPASARLATPTTAPDADAKLELRAIFFADDRRFAVVNGRRVATGDRIAGAEVVAIEVDRVRLRRGGETLELELVAPAFKNARRSGRPSPSPAAPLGVEAEPPSDPSRGALR